MPPTLEAAQAEYKRILGWAATQAAEVERATRRKLCREDLFFLLVFYLRRSDVVHPWIYERCKEVQEDADGCLDVWSRFHYKMVSTHEPVPTPTGWRRHGDLEKGDYVFGPDGKPAKVIARTQVWTDGDCYRVTFDKGYSVVVGGDHLWDVDLSHKARVKGTTTRTKRRRATINTRDLAKEVVRCRSLKTRVLPSVAVTAPLQFGEKDLPIAPYVLGAWLGDGTSATGNITCGDRQLFAEIEKTDRIGPNRYKNRADCENRSIASLSERLTALGIRGKGRKRIPRSYLEASVPQRFALLQGLMDTDGHCDTRGTATFVNINPALASDVFELAASLGLKPSLRQHFGTHKGKPYPFLQVSFQAMADEMPVFRLTRKQKYASKGLRTRSSRHAIVSVEPVPSEPCSCIQVDRDDGLYLIGRHMVPTHNSTILTFAKTIQDIITDPEITVGIYSNTADLARQFLRQIKTEFEDNGELKQLFDDILWSDPQNMASKWSEKDGIIVKRRGNPKEATIEAFGLIDQQPTSKHFSHRIYDDIVTQESVGNPDTIKKTTERWELSLATGYGTGGRNIERYVGTFYHGNDTYQEIMRRGVVKVRRYPATENGRADGEPVLMSREALNTICRGMGTATAAMQIFLDVKGGSVRAFPANGIRWWVPKRAGLNVYIIVDPASGKKRYRGGVIQNDYTSMLVFGVDGNENRLVLTIVRDRLNLNARTEMLFRLHRQFRPIQQVGYEEAGMQSDIEHIQYVQGVESYRFDITPLKATQPKPDVIESCLPQFETGKWYLPEGGVRVVNSEGRSEDVIQTFLQEEYNLYPVAKHDDTLNCFGLSNHPDVRIVTPGFDYSKIAAARLRRAERRKRSIAAL